MLGLLGSAIYSAEMFMPRGAILVPIQSPDYCECVFAYCGAASTHREFLFVLATTIGVSCDMGGPWLDSGRKAPFVQPGFSTDYGPTVWARKNGWGWTRHFNPQELVRGLKEVLALAEASDAPLVGTGAPAGQTLSARFRSWALHNGHQKACGGYAVQMSDDGAPWTNITDTGI